MPDAPKDPTGGVDPPVEGITFAFPQDSAANTLSQAADGSARTVQPAGAVPDPKKVSFVGSVTVTGICTSVVSTRIFDLGPAVSPLLGLERGWIWTFSWSAAGSIQASRTEAALMQNQFRWDRIFIQMPSLSSPSLTYAICAIIACAP